jgi:hypothetical protein
VESVNDIYWVHKLNIVQIFGSYLILIQNISTGSLNAYFFSKSWQIAIQAFNEAAAMLVLSKNVK